MKLIHCADLHLDSKMESNLSPEQAKTRREELLYAFERMVDDARRLSVTAILIAGDMFDKPHVRKSVMDRVLESIEDNPDIDFLYLQGNHDASGFLRHAGDRHFPDNLKLFTDASWTSYAYDDVVVSGREFSDENSRLIATDLVLDREKINIVMLHGQESEYEGRDKTHVVNLSEFKGKNIDYLALGHIHTYKCERLDDRGAYCYSGCLEGRGFDECGQKGYVLIDITDGKVTSEFVPIAGRQLHEAVVEISPQMAMKDIISAARETLSPVPEKDLVKLVLTGTREMDTDIDIERITREFGGRFFFFKVSDDTAIHVDYESFRADKTLKGEYVRLMQEQTGLTEDDRARIIEIGIRAIMGEELL